MSCRACASARENSDDPRKHCRSKYSMPARAPITHPEPISVKTTFRFGCRSSTPPQIMCVRICWQKKKNWALNIGPALVGCGTCSEYDAAGIVFVVDEMPIWEFTGISSSSSSDQIGSGGGEENGQGAGRRGKTTP